MKQTLILVMALAGGAARAQGPIPGEVPAPSCTDAFIVEGYGSEYGGNACRKGGGYGAGYGGGDGGGYNGGYQGHYLSAETKNVEIETRESEFTSDVLGVGFSEAEKQAFEMAQRKCSNLNSAFSPRPLGPFRVTQTCESSGYGIERPVIRVFRTYLCDYPW